MSDLGDLSPLLPSFQLLLLAFGPEEKPGWVRRSQWKGFTPEERRNRYHGLISNYIRLVDYSIECYSLGRTQLDSFVANCKRGNLSMWHAKAATSFETCLVSMHRSIRYAEKLFTAGIRRPKAVTVFRENAQELLRNFRDSIHHFENDIDSGNLPTEFSSCLFPKVAQLEFMMVRPGVPPVNLVVSYSEIATWLRQLQAFATILLEEYRWSPVAR